MEAEEWGRGIKRKRERETQEVWWALQVLLDGLWMVTLRHSFTFCQWAAHGLIDIWDHPVSLTVSHPFLCCGRWSVIWTVFCRFVCAWTALLPCYPIKSKKKGFFFSCCPLSHLLSFTLFHPTLGIWNLAAYGEVFLLTPHRISPTFHRVFKKPVWLLALISSGSTCLIGLSLSSNKFQMLLQCCSNTEKNCLCDSLICFSERTLKGKKNDSIKS